MTGRSTPGTLLQQRQWSCRDGTIDVEGATSELYENTRSHTGAIGGRQNQRHLLQQQQVRQQQRELLNNSDDKYWGENLQVAAATAQGRQQQSQRQLVTVSGAAEAASDGAVHRRPGV